MIWLAPLLIIVGLVMLIAPTRVWWLVEAWQSTDATAPSALYLLSTRFGGFLCISVGLANLLFAYEW